MSWYTTPKISAHPVQNPFFLNFKIVFKPWSIHFLVRLVIFWLEIWLAKTRHYLFVNLMWYPYYGYWTLQKSYKLSLIKTKLAIQLDHLSISLALQIVLILVWGFYLNKVCLKTVKSIPKPDSIPTPRVDFSFYWTFCWKLSNQIIFIVSYLVS